MQFSSPCQMPYPGQWTGRGRSPLDPRAGGLWSSVPAGHPSPSAWSLLQPRKTHVSLVALVTSMSGRPQGLELEGKLEEVTRDGRLYQKRGTFLLRYMQALPLTSIVCPGLCFCSVEGHGGQGELCSWEVHAGLRGPDRARSSETSHLSPLEAPASLVLLPFRC